MSDQRMFPNMRVRLMPNTPSRIGLRISDIEYILSEPDAQYLLEKITDIGWQLVGAEVDRILSLSDEQMEAEALLEGRDIPFEAAKMREMFRRIVEDRHEA